MLVSVRRHFMRRSIISWLGLLAFPVAGEHIRAAESSWICSAQPVERCYKHRGRLSSQNGIPLVIWLVGTTRRVRVDKTEIPAFLEKYLDMTSDDHSYVFGSFEICPLESDTPGRMRSVCVFRGREPGCAEPAQTRSALQAPLDVAEKTVVQNAALASSQNPEPRTQNPSVAPRLLSNEQTNRCRRAVAP